MQIDTGEILKKLKVHIGTLQYELITHQVAVDVLERDKIALKQELEEVSLELQRIKRRLDDTTN